MVAIPQSDLLSQVSSLRLPSGHSGPVLTLRNAACIFLPSPHLLVAGAGICGASPLRELPLVLLSVGFNYLFIFHLCYFALCWEELPHARGAVAARAQAGLEDPSHVEGQEGWW